MFIFQIRFPKIKSHLDWVGIIKCFSGIIFKIKKHLRKGQLIYGVPNTIILDFKYLQEKQMQNKSLFFSLSIYKENEPTAQSAGVDPS